MSGPTTDQVAEHVAAELGVAHGRVVDAMNRAFDAVFRAVADGGDAWVVGLGHLHLEVGPPPGIRFHPEPPVAAELDVPPAVRPAHFVAQLPGNLTASTGRTGDAMTALIEACIRQLRRTVLGHGAMPWPGVGSLVRDGDGFGAQLTEARQVELAGAQACQWAELKARLGD